MQIQDIYSQSDMLHLTKDDFDQIKDAVDISTDVDSAEYLYANLNKLLDVELANKIIKNKALAGQISVKWYNFVYEGTLTQESLKARLESEAVGYNVPLRNIDINLVENNIATVYNEENVYIIKIILSAGKKKISDGVQIQQIPIKTSIIVKIDIENCWVEIRAKDNLCTKVTKILETKLGIINLCDVRILKNYHNDINAFKEDLINGFWNSYRANPSENIELTENDQIAIVSIIRAIDEFLNGKNVDEKIKVQILANKLENVNIDTEGMSLESLILAGIDNLALKVRPESNVDLGKQTLYALLKEEVLENTGHITFSNVDGGPQYTLQVGKSTNSIYFMSSVTEEVIEYIREKIL